MTKTFFIKLVTDPEVDLRKCIVGLACAAQAVKVGHNVSMFFASNAVRLLNSEYLHAIDSSGDFPDGMVLTMMKTVTDGAKGVYVSTGSQAANGVTKENAAELLLEGWSDWMVWSGPPGVIELSAATDIQLVY